MSHGKNGRIVPPSIIGLKKRSALLRGRLIERYASIEATPERPPCIDETGDIISSHIKRSTEELSREGRSSKRAHCHYAWTRSMTGGYEFSGEAGALSEVCVGVMGSVLEAKGSLQVAAGFFSTMVASIDDYLDREGSYAELGERLYYISHAYRDLMDMALDDEAAAGRISAAQRLRIKERLFDVVKTLAGSEAAPDAQSYLYEKSCGDKVIGVLFPASNADGPRKEACAEIGRLVGEAGQLIDDVIDYEDDREKGARNYIIETGTGVQGALNGARERVARARGLSARVESDGAVAWILDSLDEVTGLLAGRLSSGRRIDSGVLNLCASLKALMPEGVPPNQFLIWF